MIADNAQDKAQYHRGTLHNNQRLLLLTPTEVSEEFKYPAEPVCEHRADPAWMVNTDVGWKCSAVLLSRSAAHL